MYVSNNILNRAFEKKIEVSPMKLQRLMYFVASEYAKQTHKPLLTETFRPWQYGPALTSIYHKFRVVGGEPIEVFNRDAKGRGRMVNERKNPALKAAIESVLESTKEMSAVDLSRITHLSDSAWSKAYGIKSDLDNNEIEADLTYKSALGL